MIAGGMGWLGSARLSTFRFMGDIGLEAFLILVLVIANGVFSMSEMAIVSSRKARLRQRADEGGKGASVALELAEKPDDFLSTVQIGITMIGTLAGAFGGATIAEKLAVDLREIPVIAPYANSAAIAIVVLIITYLSLILGELVPKSLALSRPETIASLIASPMQWLSRIGSPAVRFLSFSTRVVLKLLPIKQSTEAPVTEEEVKVLIAQGTQFGTFHEAEQEMVEGVFRLGDRRVSDLMQPRGRVVWLDVEDSWAQNEAEIVTSNYSRFLVAEGDLDRLLGVVHVKDIFIASRDGGSVDLRALARKPLFVPEITSALRLLAMMQEAGAELAVVVDEHGGVEGIVTLADFTDAVIGEVGPISARPQIMQREDGSWLADGSLSIADLLDALRLREFSHEEDSIATVGGLVLAHLQRIPTAGEHFVADGWRFEVVDMDGNRIDKVLIERTTNG